MGQGDAAVKQWLGNRERFADLFNGVIFDGKQVVLAGELEVTDSEANILDVDKVGKPKEIRRHRDIVMKWKRGAELVILACENQEKVHYAMPVRCMVYDGLSYTEQTKRVWDDISHDERNTLSEDEFLSGFRKTDKIHPVITIVLYYGREEWDGNKELYEMFGEEFWENAEKLKEYIPNYRINLLDVAHAENVERFQTDLQEVLGMLKYRNNKNELMAYLNHKSDYFRHVDRETYQVIRTFLKSEKILKDNIGMNGEETDMCKALEDLVNESVEKGIEQGAGNERVKTMNNVKTMLNAGVITIENVREFFDFSKEELEQLQTM